MEVLNWRRMHFDIVCLFAFFLLICDGLTNAENFCQRGCAQPENGILKYKPGNAYEYSFDSFMAVSLSTGSSTEHEETSLKLAGSAKLFVEGNCNYVLQLTAIKVTTVNTELVEKRIMQSITKPIRFSWADGFIAPDICADEADDIYSLNIKRGIISMFQMARDSKTNIEVDIFGQCPTLTSISKDGSTEIITKMRNLNNCRHRGQILSSVVNGVVDNTGFRSTMPVQANYAKELRVEDGITNDARLVEDYFFIGAQKGNTEVKAKVITTMKLRSILEVPAPNVGSWNVSIMFQKPNTYTAKNIPILKALITELVQTNSDYVQKDSAKNFAEIIRLMRNSDADSLLQLGLVPFPKKALARKVYLDALFRTGTAESAKAIFKQFSKLNEKEKSLAILSLSIIQTVDKETIAQASVLLTPSAPQEAFLAIGRLIAKYCQNTICENSPQIQGITKKFIDGLKHCKANTGIDEARIIYVLKGIGNAIGLDRKISPILTECAGPGRSQRIRISALQAYSSKRCDSELRQNALQLLRDYNEDSEVRIEAYLAAVQCPTAELANDIAEIVNNEKVNQVGGFIVSHLRSVRDSTDAHRENLRYFLGNIRINRKFPQDIKRYSYTNELSYRFDNLGLSASADYKLIFSQRGFLPRSVRLNITSELFGTNFNVMEANIRQENLENILEYFLGPKGLLNKDVDEILKVSGVGRSRRSIAEDSAKFANKYKAYGSKKNDALNLDISMKFFGSEMLFLSLGDSIPSTIDEIIRKFSSGFDDIKKEALNFQRDLHMHSIFLDAELVYPTGIGLPFEFSAQGTAISKINFGLSFDIDAILEQNWQRTKYYLKLEPSVDLSINIAVGFNAFVVSTGVRVSSSMQSATGADVNMAFINDNGFSVDIRLPREKLDLIHLHSSGEFYVSEQDRKTKEISPKISKLSNTENFELCFDQLQSIGLDVCFHSLQGKEKPSSSWLKARKAGVYTKNELHYLIKGDYVPESSSGTKQWRLNFVTPNSQESHGTSLFLEIGLKPRGFARFSIDYPHYHFAIEAGISNDEKELAAYTQYEQNNDIHKNVVGFTKKGNEYRPIISIQDKDGNTSNEISGYRADGRIVVQKIDDKSAHYNFENFQITNGRNQNLVVNGWADISATKFKAELKVSSLEKTYLVKSSCQIGNGLYELGTYITDLKDPESLLGASTRIRLSDTAVGISLMATAYSWEVNTETDVEYIKDDRETLILSGKFKSDLSIKHKKQIFGEISCVGYTEGQKNIGIDVNVKRGKHSLGLSSKFQMHQHDKNNFLLEISGKLNKHFIDIMTKCDVIGNNYKVDNVVTSSWGTVFSAKGTIGQRFTAQDIFVDVAGTAQLNVKDKPNQWSLKIIGAPEKTLSEFKLSHENQDIIKYSGETMHPQDKIVSAKLNFAIINYLFAKIDHKVAKNGKGELTAHVETMPADARYKINLDSKFHIQSPKYDIEATLTTNDKKLLYLKTENQWEKSKISTRNLGEVAGKKIALDMNMQTKGTDWRTNGEISGNFLLDIPADYVWDGSFMRKIGTNGKTGMMQGQANIEINEQHAGNKRALSWSTKIEKLHLKLKGIIADSKIVFSDYDGKNVTLDCYIKHELLNGEKYSIDLKVLSEINTQRFCEVALAVNEYDSKHALANFNLNYKNDIILHADGNYKMDDQKSTFIYKIHSALQVPKTQFKSFELSSNGKISNPSIDGKIPIYLIEFDINQKTGNGQFIDMRSLYSDAHYKKIISFVLQTENMESPFKIEGAFQQTPEESKERKVSKTFLYEITYDSKYVKTFGSVNQSENAFSFHYALHSNVKSANTVEIVFKNHKISTGSEDLNAQLILNNEKYALTSQFHYAMHKNGLEIDVEVPYSEEHVVVAAVFENLGEDKGKFTGEVRNLIGFDFKCLMEAEYKNFDQFQLDGTWHSEKLQLKNYNLKLNTQDKSIVLLLTNAAGTVLSGNAAYELKQERNKSYIEGQGKFLYKGKSQIANFKIIRQIYDLINDKELGFSYTFNGNVGTKNGVSTFKITNKDFNVKFSVCEEKKQCNNVQVQSLFTTAESSKNLFSIESMQHSLLILVDFRELGYPYEFELQSKTMRQGLQLQYSLDSNIISNNNHKYQLFINMIPKSSKMRIKIPTREILLETVTINPESSIFGEYKYSVECYLDKIRKPNDVTRLSSTILLEGAEKSFDFFKSTGEIRFERASMRPLTITSKIDLSRSQQLLDFEIHFDIFRTPEQKVVITSQIQNYQIGEGFNITSNQQLLCSALGFNFKWTCQANYDAKNHEILLVGDLSTELKDLNESFWLNLKRDHLQITMQSSNHSVFKLIGDLSKEDRSARIHTTLDFLTQTSFDLLAEVGPSSSKIQLQSENLMNAFVELKSGEELHFHADGAGNVLVDSRVALNQANFLETTWLYNENNINQYLEIFDSVIKTEAKTAIVNINRKLEELRDHVKRQTELSKKMLPDFTQLNTNLNQDLQEIIHELEQDPALKPITDLYRKMYSRLTKITEDLSQSCIDVYTHLGKSFSTVNEKLTVVFNETILPIIKDIFSACSRIIENARKFFFGICNEAIKTLLTFGKKHGYVLKNCGKFIFETAKPYFESIRELLDGIAHTIEQINNEIYEFVSQLPSFDVIVNDISKRIEKFKIAEKFLQLLDVVFEQLDLLPKTQEAQEFLDQFHNYLKNKLYKKKTNDGEIINKLLQLSHKGIKSLWPASELFLPVDLTTIIPNGVQSFSLEWLRPFDVVSGMAELATFRLSLLNFLVNEDWLSYLIREIKSPSYYLNDFGLHGHIADGHHIFTFDGEYFSFNGNCKYILAQDSVNNNFTVIAQLTNGKLRSIVLTDHDGSFLEVNDAGSIKLNGIPMEYPLHKPGGMHAWRKYYTVWLLSEYGVKIMCTSDLKVCHVNVNGFYTGKIRGLLGNGNSEPFDDLMLVDGTIGSGLSNFVNNYSFGKCPAFPQKEHDIVRSDICSEIFGNDSPLAIWFAVKNASPYRYACDQAVMEAGEKDKESAACNIALTYGSALSQELKYSILPPRCLKCPGAIGQRDLYQEFTAKIPNNKADIVFVVDMGISPVTLNGLVAPVINGIRDSLKTRGLTDIQISVIAYNESQKFPALLTSDNGKLNYHGNVAKVELNGPKSFCDGCLSQIITDRYVLDFIDSFQKVIKSIVPQSDEIAFEMALNFPFRAGAAKSIIDIRGRNVEYHNSLKWMRAQIADTISKFNGAILHLLAPVRDLSLEGVSADKLIGFNSRLVATLDGKDAKKRQKLQFRTDVGIDLALNSGGWIFAIQNFDSLKTSDQKKALSQMTNSIADTLFKTEIVAGCKCLPVLGLHAQHLCAIKSSNFVPNKKLKAA